MFSARHPWQWLVGAGLMGIISCAIYFIAVGPPGTMTVARADSLYANTLQPGDRREAVETWLIAQGIPKCNAFLPETVCYSMAFRGADEVDKSWMGARGDKSMAELAGLSSAEVFSLVRVTYPKSRFFRSWVEVFLFFDARGRLLKHWVDEFQISL